LVSSIESAGHHLLLGEISLPAAFRVLSEAGRDDVVYKIATRTTSPSYGYQVLAGNTTLGESWDGGSGQSQNHFMLGAIDAWFTQRLAGLDQTPDSVGYRELRIAPAVVGDLTSAGATHTTPYGEAATRWSLDGDRLSLTAKVPAGSTARVEMPVSSGDVHAPKGARFVEKADGVATYEVGAGTWTFASTYEPAA
jgi:alpha-L-rhamnosidase